MSHSPQKVKFFMYLLFFMLGIVVSVIIVTNTKMTMKYSWIPFLTSTVVITFLILLFDKDEVSLRSLLLAAIGSVVAAFTFAATGIVSGAVLSFHGISALLGLGVGASGMAAGAAAAATGAAAAVAVTAAVADPQAVLPILPRSRESTVDWLDEGGAQGSDWFGGSRRRRRHGGRKLLWRW